MLPRLDLLVEFSTLGEYGLDETGRPLELREPATVSAPSLRTRGDCIDPPVARSRRESAAC